MANKASKNKTTDESKKNKNKDDIKRLYKSQYDRMIGGVASGIAEYLKFDVTIIRIVFVLMTLFGGTGLIIYIAGLLIMPEGEKSLLPAEKVKIKRNNTGFWGVLLIIVGLLFILPDIRYFRIHDMWMWHGAWDLLLPIMAIAIGAWILLKPSKSTDSASLNTTDKTEENSEDRYQLTRSVNDRKISGVCGGIGEYFNIDSTIIRILWVLATLASAGFGILAYIIMIIVLSESDKTDEEVQK